MVLHSGLTLTCCLFISLILLFSYYSILVGSCMFSKYIIISSSKVKKKLSFSCVCLLHSSLSFFTVFSRIPESPNRAGGMSIITMCLIFRVKYPVLEHHANGWVLFRKKEKGNIGALTSEFYVHSDCSFKRLTSSAAGRVNNSSFREGRGMK